MKEKLKRFSLVIFLIGIFLILINSKFVYSQSADSPWPMFQHDAQHTGRSQYAGPENNINWTYNFAISRSRCGVGFSPLVIGDNNIIYFGSYTCNDTNSWGRLSSLYPNGSLNWQEDLNYPINAVTMGPSNTLYISTYNGNGIYAFYSNGTEKWHFINQDYHLSAITVDNNENLYFTNSTYLHSLYPNGSLRWISKEMAPRGGSAMGGPAVTNDGTVYVIWTGFRALTDEQRGELRAYYPNGTLKWQTQLAYRASSPVIDTAGFIYVVAGTSGYFGTDRQLYSFYPNGTERWRSNRSYGHIKEPVITIDNKIILTDSWSIVVGECWGMYVWRGVSQIQIFDSNGNVIWTTGIENSSSIDTIPVTDKNNNIFVGRTLYGDYPINCGFPILGRKLYKIDINNNSRWILNVSGTFGNSMIIGKDSLFFPLINTSGETNEIKIYAISSYPEYTGSIQIYNGKQWFYFSNPPYLPLAYSSALAPFEGFPNSGPCIGHNSIYYYGQFPNDPIIPLSDFPINEYCPVNTMYSLWAHEFGDKSAVLWYIRLWRNNDGSFTTDLSCSDNIKNGNETDVDCGGSCPKCVDGKSCIKNSDCQSDFCHHGTCIRPDLTITNITPIQTIQDIPLIKDKATMVRVFVNVFPEDIEELFNVTVELEFEGQKYYETANLIRYNDKLYVVPNKQLKKFNEFRRTNNKDTIKQMLFDYGIDAFNFEDPLYPRTEGNIVIKAKVDSNNKINESDEGNNEKIMDFKVKVFPKEKYKVHFQRWSRNGIPSDFVKVNNDKDFQDFAKSQFDYLIATYPLPEGNSKFSNDKGIIIEGKGWRWRIEQYAGVCSVFKNYYDKVVFIVPENNLPKDFQGLRINLPLVKSCVFVDETAEKFITAHEIGHTYGYKDEYKYYDEKIYPQGIVSGDGWDVIGGWSKAFRAKINLDTFNYTSPFNYYSFMHDNCSNCWAPKILTLNTYNTLLEKLGIGIDPRVLVVTGIIYKNDTVELLPFYSFDGFPDVLEPGNYSFECLSPDEEILCNVSFEAYFFTDNETRQNVSPFVFNIPYPENTSKIVLKHNENILKEVFVTPSIPLVEILSVNNLGNENYEIIWNASDSDEDNLTYSIFYSHNSIDWLPLVFSSNDTNFSYFLNTTNLPGSNNSVIKIIITDGINTVEAISSPFEVSNKKPSAFISRPLNGSIFAVGSDIIFEGWAYDPEEFELNDSSFVWKSNIDGIIGTGTLFMLSNLSIGIHNINLTVNDKHNISDMDIITISVLPDLDLDEIPDLVDNCPAVYNPGQEDFDNDTFGDICDPCTEYSSGFNYLFKDNISSYNGTSLNLVYDSCSADKIVSEYYCYGNQVKSVNFPCPKINRNYKCIDGKCTFTLPPPTPEPVGV